MTVSSTLNKHIYVGNGTTRTFDYTFYTLSEGDLKLYLTNTTTGVETQITTNFSVTPATSEFPSSSGTVTYPVTGTPIASNQKLTIIRTLGVLQPTVYPNNSSLKPKVVETSLDRITMIAQQLQEISDRTIKGDVTSTSNYSLPSPVSNAMLGWNSGATAIENKSAISNVFAVSDVQGAIDHVTDTSAAHAASSISNTPSGTISSTTVQGSINELDGDITKINNENIADKRFRSALGRTAQRNSITFIGDSITEGTLALDFANDGYVGVIRKAIQKEYEDRSHGFVSFRDLTGTPGVTNYHSFTYTSGFSSVFNPNYYGGIRMASVTNGDSITITFVGKDSQLVFGRRDDGGVLQVNVDGVNVGTIDTRVANSGEHDNASFSATIAASAWGSHTIILTKTDSFQTDLCGMMYFENASTIKSFVNNVGRSSITATEIPDYLLNIYAGTGSTVLALGVNDQLTSTNITTFRNKLITVISRVANVNGAGVNGCPLIICDFMFSLSQDNTYKQTIREVVALNPGVILLDFAKLWFGTTVSNQNFDFLAADGVHPTVKGHEFIANTILRVMGLPYTKKLVSVSQGDATLLNGWVAFNTSSYAARYTKNNDGYVKIAGMIKSGTATAGTILFTLPAGFRPGKTEYFATASNGAYGQVEVTSTGNVIIDVGSNVWLSLSTIYFKAEL